MIYLDNSATTKPAREVVEDAYSYMKESFGNPSSLHAAGRSAMHDLARARKTVADYLGCETDEVYFTSGGTESDNIAILGAANIKRGKKIVTTAIEHHAVLRTVENLKTLGFETVFVKPERDGTIDAEKVLNEVDENTCLVSVMHVNNETGAIADIEKIARGAHEINPRVTVHTDAVQSFGHIETKPYKLGCDLMSVSGHKIHALKGSGALFVKKAFKSLKSPIYGGGQEKGVRSGTENIYAIRSLAKAVELIDLKDSERVGEMRERLRSALSDLGGVYNGGEGFSPYILNMSFPAARSEVMLNALDQRGIMVSSASACARGKEKSHVLAAMGAKYTDSAIRFSLSRYTTMEEIEETIAAMGEIIKFFKRG